MGLIGGLSAGPDALHEETIRNSYEKAQRYLKTGTAEERAYAAQFLGLKQNSRYVRDLGDELNHDLDQESPYLEMVHNDPYIKSKIAWALGNIGHKNGLPYLLRALENTFLIIKERRKDYDYRLGRERQRYAEDLTRAQQQKNATGGISINREPMHEVFIPEERPGPLLLTNEHGFQYSPDMYWSLSDEFKHAIAIDMGNETNRLRKFGFNYINLYFYIIDAIGEIYQLEPHKENVKVEDVRKVALYLNNEYYSFVRSAAAVALGKIGSPAALKILEDQYGVEKDPEVKVKLLHALLHNKATNYKYFKDLLELLKSNANNVRYAAAVAFRDLNSGESLSYLIEAEKVEGQNIIRQVLAEAIVIVRRSYTQTPLP